MAYLVDNNNEIVARGFTRDLLRFVMRQRAFDPSYALWLVLANGQTTRVL
jgi:hypothetical protein